MPQAIVALLSTQNRRKRIPVEKTRQTQLAHISVVNRPFDLNQRVFHRARHSPEAIATRKSEMPKAVVALGRSHVRNRV